MSLGHMTKQEQVVTFGGVILMGLFMIYGREYFGRVGMAVGIVAGIVLIFAAKAWCWQYTNYEDGFSNPKFDRGRSDE